MTRALSGSSARSFDEEVSPLLRRAPPVGLGVQEASGRSLSLCRESFVRNLNGGRTFNSERSRYELRYDVI